MNLRFILMTAPDWWFHQQPGLFSPDLGTFPWEHLELVLLLVWAGSEFLSPELFPQKWMGWLGFFRKAFPLLLIHLQKPWPAMPAWWPPASTQGGAAVCGVGAGRRWVLCPVLSREHSLSTTRAEGGRGFTEERKHVL